MSIKRTFCFCESCSPVNGSEVFECDSDFNYCGGGHFVRSNQIAKLIELTVDLKETMPSTDPTQARNGGNYEYRTHIIIAGGMEPAPEAAEVELVGQSSPVFLGAPAPTPAEEERMNKATEALWEVMERNASGRLTAAQ